VDLKDLRSLVAVAEAYGFRRAADHLGVEQSALSRRIRNLEEELGVSLFERHRGGVRLTFAGTRFVEDIGVVLSHLEGAVRRARAAGRAEEGSLKIGVVASATSGFLNSVLRSYRAAHPDVAIELIEGDLRMHIRQIVGRFLDVAVLPGRIESLGCDTLEVWQEPLLVALSRDHPRASAATLQMAELADETFIVSQAAPGPQIHDCIIRMWGETGLSRRVEHYQVGREGLMALVGLGVGVSLISGAEADVAYPNVRFVMLPEEVLHFSLAWSPENDNPALRRFLSAARVEARKVKSAAPWRTLDQSP
jgi:DNA-binding transcriptional LysR family regulator